MLGEDINNPIFEKIEFRLLLNDKELDILTIFNFDEAGVPQWETYYVGLNESPKKGKNDGIDMYEQKHKEKERKKGKAKKQHSKRKIDS